MKFDSFFMNTENRIHYICLYSTIHWIKEDSRRTLNNHYKLCCHRINMASENRYQPQIERALSSVIIIVIAFTPLYDEN